MAAAATSTTISLPAVSRRRDGASSHAGCRPPSRVSATAATTTASSPEAAAPLTADLAPAPLMRVVPESLQGVSGSLVGVRKRGAAAGEGDAVGDADGPGAMEYLTSVLSSKVYDVAIESPLQLATKLSERIGVNLWIKREDLQPVIIDLAALLLGWSGFSFKWTSFLYVLTY